MRYDRILMLFILCLFSISGQGQRLSSPIESAEVRWVSQYPSAPGSRVKSNRRFVDVLAAIAGVKKDRSSQVLKPVGILSASKESFWMINQYDQTLQRYEKGRTIVPGSFQRKKHAFQSIVGCCRMPGSGILFTDSRLNKIFLLSGNNKAIHEFGHQLNLNQPTGIAISKSGQVWVIETAAHKVSILDHDGNLIRTFGQRGKGDGEFNYPTSIWIDADGVVYIVDALNYRIQIFDADGNFVRCFGKAGHVSGSFALPKSVATDSYGDIYVVDALLHNVQIFDRAGNFLLAFGSQGREHGQFWLPSAVYIDPYDTIYIADTYNARVQLFTLDKIRLTDETKDH